MKRRTPPRIVVELPTRAEHAKIKRHVKNMAPPQTIKSWVLGLVRGAVQS